MGQIAPPYQILFAYFLADYNFYSAWQYDIIRRFSNPSLSATTSRNTQKTPASYGKKISILTIF